VKKVLFILFVLILAILTFKFSFSQEYVYGVGINFSNWAIETTSTTIKISKNKVLEKIVNYFYPQNVFEQDKTDYEESLSLKIFRDDVEKLSKLGFGNREIIRLALLRNKVPLTTKSLLPIAQLCIKKGSVKKVVERFGLNYEEIWLESNNIYDKIVNEE
jgi:hypothetical protein